MSLLTIVLFVAGLILLISGAELLVRGSSRLAVALGVSPLVVGLTVVAFGTGSPELAVSVESSFRGQMDIAVGNVVGSNIFNVLFVLGLSALVTPLLVSQQLVRLDVPLMIVVSATLLLMAFDGELTRREGIVLFGSSIIYVLVLIRISRREAETVRREYEIAYGTSPKEAAGKWPLHALMALLGLGLLVVGARWLVEGAVAIAQALGVSQLIIGLTIIAAGTSLPEVATSVVAGLRGERDIAVGNVVGSNLFNILVVLGSAAIIAPQGVGVAEAAVKLDIPVMLAAAVLCLPIFFVNYRIGRWEGALFLSYYVFYTFYLILDAAEHDALTQFFYPMMAIVIPLTIATVTLAFLRELLRRARAHRRPAD